MTTLGRKFIKSVICMIVGLTDSDGLNGCAIPELVTGKLRDKNMISHQTTLVDFTKKEVL